MTMLAAFCLRLAFGVLAFLPLLPVRKMHPRFCRTQFLTAFGLAVVAATTSWWEMERLQQLFLCLGIGAALIGALAWTLEPPPLGRIWGPLGALILAAASVARWGDAVAIANSLSAGLLLGAALTTMLVGHSYLISPGLTIQPLMTMLAAGAASLAIRCVVLAIGFVALNREFAAEGLATEVWLWLVPRWLIGLGGLLVFGFMAYRAARIRSTQSATGILYVVVVCTFLGELFDLLIARATSAPA